MSFFDWVLRLLKEYWSLFLQGAGYTVVMAIVGTVVGFIIGLLIAIVRTVPIQSGDHPIKRGLLHTVNAILTAYVEIIRGTPMLVQALIFHYSLFSKIGIPPLLSAIIIISVNTGAYLAEIVRGGIMSVDAGQIEAGRSLGLNYGTTMLYIVFPQAFKAVLPSLANEFITLLKESSVAFYIGVADLTQGGLKIRSITYSNFMPLIAVALIYLVMVLVLTKLVGILERRLRKDER